MIKSKKYLLSLIVIFLVVLASVAFVATPFNGAKNSAYADIPASTTGFTPTRNKSEETVYHLFRTQIGELTAGKEIMFVGGEGLANTMVVPVIPPGSATLRVTSSGKAYITESLTCYVDVIERGNGFDWCESGTLNYNATEYSCSYSGVQHYKGAPFNYSSKKYYNTARVGVFQNNVAVTNASVKLYDGESYFSLNNEGNGYYSNNQIFNGEYEIIVNNAHTGQPLVINKFTIGDDGYLDGAVFYSGNTYSENVYFYTMQVKTYLDGSLSNTPGDVYLKSPCTNCALTRTSAGVYDISYIMKESSVRENYSVIVGGRNTGYTLNDFTNSSFNNSASIYFYTLKVNITADTAWTDAKVELRNDYGEVRSVLSYKSTSGTTTLYSNIMQKDEASSPEKMTVFVDYVSTDEPIYAVRTGQIGSEGDQTFVNLTYYNATINLRLDNSAFTLNYPVTVSNGVSSYSLTNSTGTLSLRVRQIMSNNQELPYSVVVSGVTDNLSPLTFTKENKTVTYNYYTVKFYTYNLSGTNYNSAVYRTQYVRQNSTPSLVSDPYVVGMTFDKWSLTTWSINENLDNITEYNFSNAITAKTNIYPHFAKTEVKINESFIKCAVNGTQSSTGVAFRMANVTISGFEKGNNSIKSILLNLTNVESVYFYSTSGKTYKQGQNANLSTVSGGYMANQSAVTVTFNNKVSMATAQDYIRNNIVIKPIVNQDVEVTLTVSDGVLSTSSTTSITQSQWNGTQWTVKAAGTYRSWWIGSGQGVQYVYFTGNCTFNGDNDGWGGIEVYGTCYLYIPTGVTVTCNGVAGSGTRQGGAGIYVASGNTLYVLGNGTLVANGGKAGNGSNGAGGGGGWKSGSTYYSGGGGAGGAGGGGAGAGIGTHGAAGGSGGGGGAGGSVGWSSKGKAQFWGKAGSAGSTGGTPSAAGNIYATSSVTVNAYGGAKGSNGNGGGAGGYQTDSGTGWKYNHCAAGGGGGGGGAAGYAGNSIGAGGAGGGGGGGGGSGACDYHSNTDYNCIGGGKGGKGGYGANGQAGGGGNAHCDHQDVPGGNGGGAGNGGTAGASKSKSSFDISTDSNTKWTVTFTGATSNGTQYYSFNSTVITVPDYVPTGKNLFLGWKVKTYAINTYGGASSRPLTTAETTLYQPGETITTALGTYGNVVLQAVTMPYDGKIAQDKLNVAKRYFASSSPSTPTYYTYSIQTYVDNVKKDVGTMVFTINGKNYKVESSASSAGLYSLTLETNVSTFTAKVDGVNISGTLNKGSNNVYFETMKVRVTGHDNVQSVKLSGSNAPILQKDESASNGLTTVYSSVKQKNLDTNSYPIIVNGKTISTSTAVAKYGTTATVPFSKINVTLNTNMAIETVELVDSNQNSIALRNVNNTWTAVELLDNSTTYSIYANGFDTKVTTKFNASSVSATAKIYEFKLVTRINGVVSSSIAKLTVNGKETTMKTQPSTKKSAPNDIEYWSYVVVSDDAVAIESNGTQVTSVTPNNNLSETYIDYFTVEYDKGSATGDVPVDDNIYLAGDEITVLSYNNLKTSNDNSYLAGWSAGGNNYTEGDTTTITGPLVLTAVLSDVLLKVHYVDYFGELEVKSQLSLTDKLVAYDGNMALESFNDYGRTYTLKGWVLGIDETKKIYESGEVTNFVAGNVLGDSTEEVNVYFTAVYDIAYLNGLHFELEFSEEDDPQKTGLKVLGNVGETFTVNYKVTINDGVNALLLLPEYDKNIFEIVDVTANGTTALGAGTVSSNYNSNALKIAFDNTELYNTTGDILISITYRVTKTVPGKYSDFGLVLDYPTVTTEEVDNVTRSNAWYILNEQGSHSAIHNEVKIFVDNTISVTIQASGTITIAEQTVVYHAEALTVGDIFTLATTFESGETYYEFVGGEFVVNSNVNSSNFADKRYYIANAVNDVLFNYSAIAQQEDCLTPAVFTIKWYSYDSEMDTYTEINAPINVGDYYVGVSASASDFVYKVDEVKQIVHIVKANVTYTIDDKTSVWSEAIVELTGDVTDGIVYGNDNLSVQLSTTATSQSNVGNYQITGTYDNDNYNVTFVNGNYEITKKQIELGLDATAKFNDGSFAYNGEERRIYADIAEFYAEILSVTYAGGQTGCSGNGAIDVRFNDDNEVIAYNIVATFTINENYVQNCEFIKDEYDNDINTLSADLTITINGITKAQFEALINDFVEFIVVDGETNNILTPQDNAMGYLKTYDAVLEYAKVVVSTENNNGTNNKISPIITYKLNNDESVEINTATNFDYTNYKVKNANTYDVVVTFKPGKGYAFEVDVNPVYTITMTINRHSLTIGASAVVAYLDDAPQITIDNGTNSWVAGESYATYGVEDAQHFTNLVLTTYEKGDVAGTTYYLQWNQLVEVGNDYQTAEEVLSEIIYNYDITLTTTNNNIVNKKIINVNDYTFNGYSSIYDGLEHTLVVLKDDEPLLTNDSIVSYSIEHNLAQKSVVKDVADSGNYIASISLNDTDNYIFSESEGQYWTLNNTNTSATVTKEVSIAPKALIIEVEYTTKTTASLSLTGLVEQEDESVLTNLTYLSNQTPIQNTLTATIDGQFIITAQSDNTNYTFSEYKIAVYKVTFASGDYDESVAGSGYVPQNMPECQYIFSGYDADTFDVAEHTGMFTADVPAEIPTLRHYTFNFWSSDEQNQFNFATIIENNITIYAIWQENETYTITYKYSIDNQTTWNNLIVDTLYTDDLLVYGDTLQSLEEKNWFIGDVWYFDQNLQNKVLNNIYLDSDTVLYGHYRFDIGVGDVNADGNVNANDITLYRQWIVGGYSMIVVEAGDEWATVTGNSFNTNNTYFVKRVADSNAQTSSSVVLGDNSLDIRDVSTIRMALVGGYGFDIATGVETTKDCLVIISVSEIDNISKLLLTIATGKKAKISKDINESSAIVDISNLQKNIVIDLNGNTITVPSFSIALANNFDGRIEIFNGSIVAENGINLSAPSGTIVLKNVTMFDKNGEFTLSAANHSLHFVGNVELLKDDGNGNQVAADVTIPSTTHVVVESGATLTLKNIVVQQVQGHTLSIEMNNSQDELLAVQGDYVVSGSNADVINPFVTVCTSFELIDAALNGFDICIGNDIVLTNQVVFTKSATLNFNSKTITKNGGYAIVATGSDVVLTITGNGTINATGRAVCADNNSNIIIENGTFISGNVALCANDGAVLTINDANVTAQEGCVMAFDGSSFVVNGGTYTCTDNFVFGTNGSTGRGNNTITINAGTFNGQITSAGYVACGIYVANNDTVVVNGGTFNITNGVGILARSGNTTVKAGVVFNVSGNGELGKVGDSQVTVPSGKELVLDLKANYPGGSPVLVNNNVAYEIYTVEA